MDKRLKFMIIHYQIRLKKAIKLVSQEDGSLKVDAGVSSTAFYLEVKEFIGNKDGVVVLVHGATAN